ncbi:hypothetical protein [Blautia sp.]|uniref:hypothetical protein n=1 Tax=Blautia sp. TaxID=1955243 RepID=UPI002579A6F7|nr:hypothetical protein [Blautia sp.]
MSGYILCQVKRAKLPYYIENISTNIYSIEELCFYFYHNIYLLDSTILNEELCFWIRDQLGLKKLADNLYKHLDDDDMKVGDFILPVFKEINYLSLEEFRKLNQQIQQLAKEPEVLRQKRKGDYLMEHGKYVNAIKVYQKALRQGTEDEAAVTDIRKPETVAAEKAETVQEAETTEASTETKTEEAAETESPVAITIDMVEDPEERAETENVEESEKPEEDTSETDATSLQEEKQEEVAADPELPHQEILLGKQFIGEIYHNMGCAYARLFQMEEAIRCFEIAYGKLHTMGAVKSLLYAVYMEHGVDAFVEKAKELEVDEERQEEIYVEVEEAVEDLYDTPEGQEYKKLLEEKQQGREEDYQQGMKQLLEQLTAEYHKSTGY